MGRWPCVTQPKGHCRSERPPKYLPGLWQSRDLLAGPGRATSGRHCSGEPFCVSLGLVGVKTVTRTHTYFPQAATASPVSRFMRLTYYFHDHCLIAFSKRTQGKMRSPSAPAPPHSHFLTLGEPSSSPSLAPRPESQSRVPQDWLFCRWKPGLAWAPAPRFSFYPWPLPLQKRTDEAAFQKLMSNLDSNRDNEVDFQEYCIFLSCIAMMCNEFFEGFPDKQPRKK